MKPHSDMATPDACAAMLRVLLASLQSWAPRLNAELPFPDRMAITDLAAGDVRQDTPHRCSTELSLRAGDAPKSYQIALFLERERFHLIVSDETDFEEQRMLTTQPGQPLHPRDVRALYDALATDIAGHFGTDS